MKAIRNVSNPFHHTENESFPEICVIDDDNILSFIKLSKEPHPKMNIIIIMHEKAQAKITCFINQ